MARKRTGSTGGRGTSPRDETVEAPRGYSIYSEKAEKAAASEDDASLLRSVDEAVASGDSAPAEPAEPPAPGYSIFAESEEPKGPMTPEEVAREAAEDAEIIAAVDEAVGARPDAEPVAGTPAEPVEETVAEAPSEPEIASEPQPGDRRESEPEPATAGEPEVIARRPIPREPETASIPPAAVAAASARSGGGFAGKALGGVVLLLAGGALALWLGPKLAPNLPRGMAPVADFLEPGRQAAETRLAALDTEIAALKAQIANIPAGVTAADLSAAVTGARGEIDAEITRLGNQIGAGAEVPERLARLESSLRGTTTELTSLKDQIAAGGATAGSAAPTDLYRGEIDGLRAELGTLSDQVAGLRTRVDEVGAAAQRQVETAQQTVDTVQAEATQAVDTAARQTDVASVAAALAAGQPFAEPLSRLAALPGESVPETLTAAAATGAPSVATLRTTFPEAAHAAIRASIVAGAGDGMFDRAYALFRAQIATRSLSPREGASPDAVLSRMEARLNQGDLAGAIAEAEALPSEAKAAMGDWLTQAKLRAGAEAGLSALESATPATN
ncbi:MAG: hypothetical protein DI556_19460 [Rhodovulum sulfidophilum]|uniref:Mitochondrial inner membrane protein n=1 Tax=Rhodovulum sulfidophilum TaxID=35806 RepID=A0A2W5MZX2_RHOSU|nr:MAG: hypothetical protein DI556_19460 [Rhodovulum sulfidophilum]